MAFFPSNFMLQTDVLHEDDHHQPQTSLNPYLLTPQDFHGIGSFLGKRSLSFPGGIQNHEVDCRQEINERNRNVNSGNQMEGMSDDEDGLSQIGGEKKRRLNSEQVKMLEKNFELGNKLEPDRKMHLARCLGLQPRQIAIWFQNRRVRWKTKQLENDYELLKRQFDAIKAENSTLESQNRKLHAQILALKILDPAELINLNKKTDGSCSNTSENSSDINLEISRRTPPAIHSHPNNITSRSSATPGIQPQKADHYHHHLPQTVKEESFSNMLCGIDDQAEYWPWLE